MSHTAKIILIIIALIFVAFASWGLMTFPGGIDHP